MRNLEKPSGSARSARIYSEKGMPPMFVTRALALGNAMNAKKTLAGSVMVASL